MSRFLTYRRKLKASAMAYALMISLMVTLLIGSMALTFAWTREFSDTLYFRELARDNMESGLNMVLYGQGDPIGEFSGALFGSDIDSFEVRSRPWGMYLGIYIRGVHGPESAEGWALAGMVPEGMFTASLFLPDLNRPLSLSGHTRLSGDLYLPKSGLKRGYVGDKGFQGKSLHSGRILNSRGKRTGIGFKLIEETAAMLKQGFESGFSGPDELNPGDSLVQDFSGEPLMIRSGRALRLDRVKLEGQIILVAPRVEVPFTARLRDCLIIAHEIYIEEGFEGRAQFFATDTLVIEKDAKLRYPSVAAVANTGGEGFLYMEEKAVLEGGLFNDPEFAGAQKPVKTYTRVDSSALILGNVWVNENLDLQGEVRGCVMTNKFRLVLGGGVYDNHLMNAQIGREGLSETYAMPLWTARPGEFSLILKEEK